MAKVTALPTANATPAKNNNLVIFEETLENNVGKVKLLVEYPRTQSRAEQYYSALRDSRNIPFNLEAINPLDPMYTYVYEHYPHYKSRENTEKAKAKVQAFYKEWAAITERHAMLLAMIADKSNVFDYEPTEYSEEDFADEDDLPGVINPPRMKFDLTDPAERRIKQFYDWLKADPTVIIPFERAFELAVIRLHTLTEDVNTENGFRPSAAN